MALTSNTGWTPWQNFTKLAYSNTRYTPLSYRPAANPRRVRSGAGTQELFAVFGTYVGGVFQRVQVNPGTRLTFQAWLYIWSSTLENEDVSDEPGNVSVRVGLDPSGSTDATNSHVIWSDSLKIYDKYQSVTVEGIAVNNYVTVFVEGSAQLPVKHNNIYVDDASLFAVRSVVPPTAAHLPTPTVQAQQTSTQPTAVLHNPSATSNPFEPTREGTIVAGPSDTPLPLLPTNTPVPLDSGPTFTPVPGKGQTSGNNILVTVGAGDTLSILAIRYNSTVDSIAAANGISTDTPIFVGQNLVIPLQVFPIPTVIGVPLPTEGNCSNCYLVSQGDSLWAIAFKYHVTIDAIVQANNITVGSVIHPGQILIIPQSLVQGEISPTGPATTILPTTVGSPVNTLTPTLTDTPSNTETKIPTALPLSTASWTPTVTLTPTNSLTPTLSEINTVTPTTNATARNVQGDATVDAKTEIAPFNATPVAQIPVVARSASGIQIGKGTLRLYAPRLTKIGDSIPVDLELYFDELAITPTPVGPITLVPVSSPKPTLAAKGVADTPTPRQLRAEKSEIDIFQRMGASLICKSEILEGCDQKEQVDQARYIDLGNPILWHWDLYPKDSLSGVKYLEAELWSVREVQGQDQAQIEWQSEVDITVESAQAPAESFIQANLGPILVALIGLIGVVVAALIAAGLIPRKRAA